MAISKDSYNPSAGLTYYPIGGTSNQQCQTFTTTSSYKLTNVALKLYSLIDDVNGDLQIDLYAVDGSHKPTGSSLSTATKGLKLINNGDRPSGSVHTNTYIFHFAVPYLLANSTEYALVLSGDANKVYKGLEFTKTSAYSNGTFFVSTDSGSTWTAQSYGGTEWDVWFTTYTNYDIQDSNTSGTPGYEVLVGNTWGGQTFTPDTDIIIKSIELYMKRTTDTDVGAVVVALRDSDVNNKPSGEDQSIGTVYSADISTSADWVEFTLDVPVKLTEGTQYSFVVHTNQATNSISIAEVTPSNYDGGSEVVSTDAGDSWTVNSTYDYQFRIYGTQIDEGESGQTPDGEANVTTKLWAIGASEFWYTDSDGTWTQLAASIGEIDSTKPLTAVEAYGKVFIANGYNLKIADFANVKISTSTIGTHPPDPNTVLTGGTSGAVMVVDYIDALSSAVTIYGRRISNYPFVASETVTGLDDDGNNISFTTSAAETRGPHWYDWTVFGNSSNFGSMPSRANLVSLYNGRLVLAGSEDYPHEWWMSKSYEPFNWLYDATVNLSALTSGSTEAGQIGDIITALIPYGDDFFLFGCLSSVYILDGDPTYGGTIEHLTDFEGVAGARAWCKDDRSNLYYFSGNALFRADGGRHKPVSLSISRIPNWYKQWDTNLKTNRIVLVFSPQANGVVVCNTDLATGVNDNYFYHIGVDGFYPEVYPTDDSIYCSFYYKANDSSANTLLLGCADGYIREFSDNDYDDVLNDDTTSTIEAYVVLPIAAMSSDSTRKGKLQTLQFNVGRNVSISTSIAADGTITETETDNASMDYELWVEDDAESVLSDIKLGNTSYTSGTISTSGLSNKLRPRARGHFMGLKLSNDTASETFSINKVFGNIIPAGRR